MNGWRLTGWLARRDLRARELRVLLAALILAVASVSSIALLAAQLQQSLVGSAQAFLAADRQLTSAQPLPDSWFLDAQAQGLETARMMNFGTMLYANDGFQLVSVKAVSDAYPLRGDIEMQATADAPREKRQQGPAQGEIWVNARLLGLLHLQIGDGVALGKTRLQVAGILVRAPDMSFGMAALAPSVMIHLDDVAASGVVQPGSRVKYVGLFKGSEAQLAQFQQWLKPQLLPGHEWKDVRSDRPSVTATLDRAERFLLLGASLAVLLASVAVAVASRQFALQQQDTVALLKTLGLTTGQIRSLYWQRLLLWGLLGSLPGIAVGVPIYPGLIQVAVQIFDLPLQSDIKLHALWPAALTALITLFAFAWPPLARLRKVPAMQVLRRLPTESLHYTARDLLLAVLAIGLLLLVFGREPKLVLALLLAIAGLVLLLACLGWLLLKSLNLLLNQDLPRWRWLLNLYQHPRASMAQLAVFSMTIMLVTSLYLMRTALLEDWQQQLPETLPNHFLINIAPDQVPVVDEFLKENQLSAAKMYPMVRGRLTEINGRPAKEAALEAATEALNRELNLTWMTELPEDNRLQAGDWWAVGESNPLISVESHLASNLGLKLGDQVRFVIGADSIQATVASIRSVRWESMHPNFYVIFPPGALDGLPATFISSFYLPPDKKSLLNRFSQQFPTVTLLETDQIIARIRAMIDQVLLAIETILGLILLSALLVMAAVVNATLQARQREGALLRTLGAGYRLLVQRTLSEFAMIGVLAGVMGVAAGEMTVWLLKYYLFQGDFGLHPAVWVLTPVLSGLLLALLGFLQLQPVLKVSPMRLLRRLE